MARNLGAQLVQNASLSFEATGGLFGAEAEGIDWRVFLGVGSLDGPLRAPFRIGGPVSTWLPFVGDVEVLRAGLRGEIATRVGLEAGLQISAGETRATMPYEVAFAFPDAQTLAANPFFRLEGSGTYEDGPTAGFETEWPYFAFDLAAIFELSALAVLDIGVLGDTTRRKLLDIDIATRLPIVELDTRDRETPANRTEKLFGLDIGEIAQLTGDFTPDPDEPDDGGPLFDLDFDEVLSVTFDADGLDFLKSEEKEEERDETKAETTDDARDDTDPDAEKKEKSQKQKPSVLDLFETGPLATLDLRLPRIELEDRGEGRDFSLTDRAGYSARTLNAVEAAAIEETRDSDGNVVGPDPREAEIARLNLDLDNILVEIVKSVVAGPTLQKVPGFEGRIDLPFSLGGLSAGAYFDYNLFDADLNLILPVRQEVSVETNPLQTKLTFSRADADGAVIEDAGAQAAFFIEARAPRWSVYFNEGATFWDEAVADLLRLAATRSARAAEDVALFVDLDGRRIPGAFTGETGGVAGVIVRSTDGGRTWIELTTFPEETEWLARSRPIVGVEPRLEDLRPRDDAIFRYVVTDDDTNWDDVDIRIGGELLTRRQIDLATAVGWAPLTFQQLLGEGGVFDLRVDAVTAPISTTGFVEGAPSLDLLFPGIPGESVWVDVEHLASAVVSNRTTLDFDMTIALSAVEFAFGAYVRAFGGRFGLDFEFGPLWEKVYPILSTTLAALYDDSFEITAGSFTASGETSAEPQDRWGFAIGAGGAPSALVTAGTDGDDALDAAAIMGRAPGGSVVADATADGGAGSDLLTFARLAEPQAVFADLARGVALLAPGDPLEDDLAAAESAGRRLALADIENLTGGRLSDLLRGDAGANRIEGGEGDDTLEGGDGFDTLIGGPGSDVVDVGGPGEGEGLEEAFGGDGNDRIIAGAARARYDGGTGAPVGADALIPVDLDVIDYRNAPGALLIDLATGQRTGPWVEGHTLSGFEGVAGSAFGDTLRGDAGRSYLEGGAGDDLLVGGPLGEGLTRAERLALTGGPDRLYAGDGDDTLIGGPGADLLDGGAGRDLVDYSRDPVSVFVDLADGIMVDAERFRPLLIPAGTDPTDYARIDGRGWRGWAQGDKLRDVEDLRGTAFDDILFGDAGANLLEGGGGDDRLAGRFGEDTLDGGDGDDILWTQRSEVVAAGSYQPVLRDPFAAVTTGPMTLGAATTQSAPARLMGGSGRDLAILQWSPGLTIVQSNVLIAAGAQETGQEPPSELAVDLRYTAPGLTERLVASLEEGRAWVEVSAASDDRRLIVTGARLRDETDAWTAVGPREATGFFEWVTNGYTTGLPHQRSYGDWFLDAPTGFTLDAPIRVDVAILDAMEGIIARDDDDFLIGSAEGDLLASGGGADLISAGAGDDVLSFGPGQPPEQIFSFPGRGYAALADLERRLGEAYAGGASARDPGARDQAIVGTVRDDPNAPGSGGGDGGPTVQIFDPAGPLKPDTPPPVPEAQAEIDALIEAYLSGARDADALDALSRALAAADARLADYTLIDGGAGRNVLDLRFDRGLDFLSRPGPLAAMVDLEATATRFLVKPGLAVPGLNADPAAADWAPLPAFTNTAPVGEARFLTRPAADAGGLSLAEQRKQMADQKIRPALLMGVQDLIGGDANDWLFGDAAENVIEGGGGVALRRLRPDQGGGSATVSFFSDWLDGRDGFDTLSYANARGGVTFVMGQRADGVVGPVNAEGDAAGDLFVNFEAIRGSETRDVIGFIGATVADDNLNPYYARNAIAVVDAGGGNDRVLAGRAGLLFDGGAGDDVILIGQADGDAPGARDADGADRSVAGIAPPAEGPFLMAVEGGAGVDIARVSGLGLTGLAVSDGTLVVTETVSQALADEVYEGVAPAIETRIEGVEYLEFGRGAATVTLALDNLDPVVEAARTLTLNEDPWSVRRLFPESGPGAPVPGRSATVEGLSEAGVFALEGEGAPVPLRLGQTLDAATLARVIFIPNQQFGVRRAGDGDGPQALTAADLRLSFRDGDGPAQPRTIRVEPGEMDGAALGIVAPTDVAHAPRMALASETMARDATGALVGDRARLFATPDLEAAIAGTDAALAPLRAQAAEEQAQLEQAELTALHVSANLARLEQLARRGLVSQERLAAEEAARDAAMADVADRQAAVQLLRDQIRPLEQKRAALVAEQDVPSADLPRADAYTVAAITGGGALWRAEDGAAATPVLVERLQPGAVVARAELGNLIFVKEGEAVSETDGVAFAPVETVTATVVQVPHAGFVFNPVIALGLDPATVTGERPEQAVTLTEAPADGALFLRGPDGARVAVAAGDALTADQVGALFFEAGIARQATQEPEALAAALAALNRPTLDVERDPDDAPTAPGASAAPLPADASALVLQLDLGAPAAADVDGVTVDMQALGATRAVAYGGGVDFRGAPLEWRQWRLEDGGNGHFYAVASAGRTGSSLALYESIIADERGATVDIPFDLASIGSAAENDFVFGLFADDEEMFRDDIFGPVLGGVFAPPQDAPESARVWSWRDGSDWSFTAWRTGEPNNVRGAETALHYAIEIVDADQRLFRPTWNDHNPGFGATGWILEAEAIATGRNDVIDGSDAADVIRAGAGQDLVRGGAGADIMEGGAGDDTLSGGAGDDTLTGGDDDDVFVMSPNGGLDVVTDFQLPAGGVVRDRIDVSALALGALAAVRITAEADGALALHAGGQTLLLLGMAGVDPAALTDPRLYIGALRHIGAAMPEATALAVGVGDTLTADELAALRFRADPDATGPAGRFGYEARDPWALQDGIGGLADPRAADRDGFAQGVVEIALTAQNDAPRASDRSHHFTIGRPLDGRVAELRLYATDPEGDAATFVLLEGPRFGTLDFYGDGGFLYTPDAAPGVGYAGVDSFTYAVTDGEDRSAPYVVSLEEVAAFSAEARQAEPVEGRVRIGGRSADDLLIGGPEDNSIDAGPGDDTVEAGGGADLIDLGSGRDLLRLLGTGPAEIVTGRGGDRLEGALAAFNGLRVRDMDSEDAAQVLGQTAAGLSLRLTQEGGDVTATLRGRDAAATLVLEGEGESPGGGGGTVIAGPAGANADPQLRLDPAEGGAILRRADAPFEGVGLTGQGDRFVTASGAVLAVDGGDGADVIAGGAGADALFGGAGSDLLLGGAGDDLLVGGPGGDNLIGGAGADRFAFSATDGGGIDFIADFTPGEDVIALAGFDGVATLADLAPQRLGDALALALPGGARIVLRDVTGELGEDDIDFGDAARVSGAAPDQRVVRLGPGTDLFVTADARGLEVRSGGGDDVIAGGVGNDTLIGEGGSTLLLGGAGDDLLRGGPGGSNLRGGAGADVFEFDATDTAAGALTIDLIGDFTQGEDRVRLIGFAGVDAFEDVTVSAFAGGLALRLAQNRFAVFQSLTAEDALTEADFLFG